MRSLPPCFPRPTLHFKVLLSPRKLVYSYMPVISCCFRVQDTGSSDCISTGSDASGGSGKCVYVGGMGDSGGLPCLLVV